MPSPRAAAVLAACLLVLGGLAGIGWATWPAADVPQVLFAALVGAGGVTVALTALAVRPRLRLLAAAGLVAVVTDRVLGMGGDLAPAGTALAVALVLAWAAVALGPGAALRLAPAVTVGHAAAIAAAGESLALLAASPAAALAFELVAWPTHAVRAARADRRRALSGIDALVVAARDLRTGEPAEVGDRVCRLAVQLTGARGAVLYAEGPGRLVVVGRHGAHPAPRDTELGGDPLVERALRGAPLCDGEPLLVPATGETGVVGVVAVHGAARPVDEVLSGLLALFGGEAGAALARAAAGAQGVEVDPVTGAGSRRQASSVVAGVRPGDGLVLVGIDGLDDVRAAQGDQAADLLLGQLGLHLRGATRPGDAVARSGDDELVVVLRDLKAPVDVVVRRVVESWPHARPLRVGAALHIVGAAPLDTLELARSALEALAPRLRVGA